MGVEGKNSIIEKIEIGNYPLNIIRNHLKKKRYKTKNFRQKTNQRKKLI